MKNPEFKDFKFKGVKINNGVVKITAYIQRSFDGEVHTESLKGDEYTYEPHEDLTNLLLKLKQPLAKLHGLLDVETVVTAKEFGATPEQIKTAELHTQEKLLDVKVTGVTVSGTDKNRGCVITGFYSAQAINGKRVKFIGNGLGFEDELMETVDEIISETYKYLYEDKRGALETAPTNQTVIDGTGEQFEEETSGKDKAAGE